MRKLKKKYKKPKRPWDSERIAFESKLLSEYGLRRKKENWRADAIVRNFRHRARDLISQKDPEKQTILLQKLNQLGILEEGQGLENVLILKSKDVLERRLQTIIFKKGHASTIKSARQMIVHGHVQLDDRITKFPALIVPRDSEKLIKMKETKK